MASGLLSLKWNHHRSTFLHVLANIRQKESYCDVTLACAGKFYSAHKLVLSTCSEYFEEMFERTQCKHPVIVLKDIGADELEALLSYMYDGEVNVLQEHLSSLIKAAECLKIKGLAVADSDPTEHTSKGTKDKISSSNSNSKDVHRSHNSNSTSNSNNHSFQSDSSSRQFRNSSGGVKRPSLSSKQDDGPSKRRRPEPPSLPPTVASPARRHSSERPSSAPRGGGVEGKEGDDGGSDGAEGGEDGGNSMDGAPSAADDLPHEEGGPDDARSFAQGLSEQTGVKAEPVEIIDSDDMGGFDPQAGDGGSHDASDAEFTEEKFAGGGADANDPSLWGGSANNDMFSQPSTSSFTGPDGSNSNDNNSGGGKGGGGGSSINVFGNGTTDIFSSLVSGKLRRGGSPSSSSSAASKPPQTWPERSHPANDAKGDERYKQQQHELQFLRDMELDGDRGTARSLQHLRGESLPGAQAEEHLQFPEGGNQYIPDNRCPFCSFESNHIKFLNAHIRTHANQRSYPCPDCPYVADRMSNLKTHLRRHTGERPYLCPGCPKTFTLHQSLHSHVPAKHPELARGFAETCPHCRNKRGIGAGVERE